MGIDNYQLYRALEEDTRARVDDIRRKKEEDISNLIENDISLELADQTLQNRLITPDNFYFQESNRTCMTACFRMIYRSITGEQMSERDLVNAAREAGVIQTGQIPGDFIDSSILLGVYQTPEFRNRFPHISVRTVPFSGMGFDDISNIVMSIKEKVPNAKVFCEVDLKSEVIDGGVHTVVLLGADNTNVYIHDPSSIVGGAGRSILKKDFITRWGASFLSGDLIIAASV